MGWFCDSYLLCIFEGTGANIALALQRVFIVMVDPFVLHATAVGGENGAAFPPTHVRLDARVRVKVPLHVRLICT